LHIFVDGQPNRSSGSAYAAATGAALNIPDVYENKEFDFSLTRNYDKKNKYRSTSMLAIPLKNKDDYVIGVIQFINATNTDTGEIIPFDPGIQYLMERMSSLAAATMEAYRREQGLRREIQELRIEIDELKRDQEVAEITETQFFQDILDKAEEFRK
jgi:GAF domain-containing protein